MRLISVLIRKKKKKESYFKYAMSLTHLWLGLVSGLIICLVSISGNAYIFKEEFIRLTDRKIAYGKGAVASKLPDLNKLKRDFEQEYSKEAARIFIPEDIKRNLMITSTGKGKEQVIAYADRTTGDLLGTSSDAARSTFAFILRIHRWLLVRGGGQTVVAVSSFIFIFLLMSGVVLWFPLKKNKLKNAFRVRYRAKWPRLNYDLHNVLGFYTSLLLLFIVITGLCFSYTWFKEAILFPFKSREARSISTEERLREKEQEIGEKMDDLFALFLKEGDRKSSVIYTDVIASAHRELAYVGDVSLLFPNNKTPHLTVRKTNSENWIGFQVPDEIRFDDQGKLLEANLFSNKAFYKQLNKLILPLHTGEFAGMKSKILYFVLSLIGSSLPITGFFIWWNKAAKRVSSPKARQPSEKFKKEVLSY